MDASCVLSCIKLSLLSHQIEWLPATRLPTVSLSATSPSLFSAPAPDTASVLSPTYSPLEKMFCPSQSAPSSPWSKGQLKKKTEAGAQ